MKESIITVGIASEYIDAVQWNTFINDMIARGNSTSYEMGYHVLHRDESAFYEPASDEGIYAWTQDRVYLQFFNLLPELTIYENICMPSYLDHRYPDQAFLQQIVEKLGLTKLLEKYPGELSGGEQQRVA